MTHTSKTLDSYVDYKRIDVLNKINDVESILGSLSHLLSEREGVDQGKLLRLSAGISDLERSAHDLKRQILDEKKVI